jgi:hypothetical protein
MQLVRPIEAGVRQWVCGRGYMVQGRGRGAIGVCVVGRWKGGVGMRKGCVCARSRGEDGGVGVGSGWGCGGWEWYREDLMTAPISPQSYRHQ